MAEDVFSLGFGLDLVSDYLSKNPGACLSMRNMEPGINNGYTYFPRYEACDGRPPPSEQNYLALKVADASAFVVGDTVTGVSSTATGRVIGVDPTTNLIGVAKVVGTFVNGESLTVTTLTQIFGLGLGPTDLDDAWLLATQLLYRADITAVPGSGPILGVHVHRGVKLAWRNNVGGTAAELYKSTPSGWQQIPFGFYLKFDQGNGDEILEGDTITGQTSGATGLVKRVIKYAGAWNTDAEGYLVLANVTGTFQDNENLRDGGSHVHAKADGTAVAISFQPNGKFVMLSHNFYALDATYSVYGCDGVNPAWELRDDGTLSPIFLPPDAPDAPPNNTPNLIEQHRGHLFMMFDNGLVQHSVIGEPLVFSGFLGAADFGLGAPGTNMVSEAGGALILTTLRTTHALYGKTVDDWELQLISGDTGAAFNTGKLLLSFLALDDRGLVYLPRVDAYGNFSAGTVSEQVQPILNSYRGEAIGSVLVRDKNQYRLFFNDGSFLIVYLKESSYTNQGASFRYGYGFYPDIPVCLANGEDATGKEVVLFGDKDGWVYQAEKGTSDDGAEVEAWAQLAFSHAKSPRIRKRYRRAFVDLQATSALTLRVSAELQYGNPEKLNPLTVQDAAFGAAGGYWGVSNWGEFYWGTPTITNIYYPLTGSGVNISLTFYLKSATTKTFTINSVQIEYDPRRRERNA
jgi:hypothetical protein